MGDDDITMWSGTAEEGLLSQHLAESGVELDPENEELVLNISSRLQAAVEKLLEAINETSNQVVYDLIVMHFEFSVLILLFYSLFFSYTFSYVPKICRLTFKAETVLQVPTPKILLQHYVTDEFRFTVGIGLGLQRMPEFRHVYPSGAVFHSSCKSLTFCCNPEMRQEVSEHI